MEVTEMRRQLRAIMGQAQTRYSLPEGPKYLQLYDKAQALWNRKDISQEVFEAAYQGIVKQFETLESKVDRKSVDNKEIVAPEVPPVKKKRGGSRPGAGRKREGDGRNLTLTLPPGYWATIDTWMERTGQTNLTGLIRSLVVSLVDQLEESGEVDDVVCPVCSGAGTIQPNGQSMVCPGCEGERKLRQLKVNFHNNK